MSYGPIEILLRVMSCEASREGFFIAQLKSTKKCLKKTSCYKLRFKRGWFCSGHQRKLISLTWPQAIFVSVAVVGVTDW